jgi:hypothetical protein
MYVLGARDGGVEFVQMPPKRMGNLSCAHNLHYWTERCAKPNQGTTVQGMIRPVVGKINCQNGCHE